MGKFDHILICCDYDRTMTGPEGAIPPANLEAIRHFIEEGGAFSMNTGRSLSFFRQAAEKIPMNVPAILFNGAVTYNFFTGETTLVHPIQGDLAAMMHHIETTFPDLVVEVQALDAHYLPRPNGLWKSFTEYYGGTAQYAPWEQIPQPFVKLCLYSPMIDYTVAQFFRDDPAQRARMDAAEAWLKTNYPGILQVERSADLIVDASAAGTGKGLSARQLANTLCRHTLVCIGDAKNDRSMLKEADLAFVPADAEPELAALYPNVCPCGEGAVADVIRILETL